MRPEQCNQEPGQEMMGDDGELASAEASMDAGDLGGRGRGRGRTP